MASDEKWCGKINEISKDFRLLVISMCVKLKRYMKMTGKYGFINTDDGSIAISPRFDDVPYCFQHGLCGVGINGKYGFINKQGDWVIEPKYDSISFFSEGMCRVGVNGKYGFIDHTGYQAIEPKYDDAGDFHEGLCRAFSSDEFSDCKNKWGFIDKTGEWKVYPLFDEVGNFGEGVYYAYAKSNGKYGFIGTHYDIKDEYWKIKPQFDEIGDFHEELCRVCVDGEYGFIDDNGYLQVSCKYHEASDFHEGMCRVNDNCFLKDNGIRASEYQSRFEEIHTGYDKVGDFHEGLCRVLKNGKYGFVDKKWNWIVLPKFQDAGDFHEGTCHVVLDGREGCIDKEGNMVDRDVPSPKYLETGRASEGLAAILVENPVDLPFSGEEEDGKPVLKINFIKSDFVKTDEAKGGIMLVYNKDKGSWRYVNVLDEDETVDKWEKNIITGNEYYRYDFYYASLVDVTHRQKTVLADLLYRFLCSGRPENPMVKMDGMYAGPDAIVQIYYDGYFVLGFNIGCGGKLKGMQNPVKHLLYHDAKTNSTLYRLLTSSPEELVDNAIENYYKKSESEYSKSTSEKAVFCIRMGMNKTATVLLVPKDSLDSLVASESVSGSPLLRFELQSDTTVTTFWEKLLAADRARTWVFEGLYDVKSDEMEEIVYHMMLRDKYAPEQFETAPIDFGNIRIIFIAKARSVDVALPPYCHKRPLRAIVVEV